MSDEERENQEQGEEGLGTPSGGIEGGSKAAPNETDRPQPRPAG